MSKKKKTQQQLVEDAAKAYSGLNVFYAVIALMESSLVSSNCFSTESRIVTICKAEGTRCLKRYDRALAALATPPESPHGR